MGILDLRFFPHWFDLFQIVDFVVMLAQVVMRLFPSILNCQSRFRSRNRLHGIPRI